MYPQRQQQQYQLMKTGTMYHPPLIQQQHIVFPTNQVFPPPPPPSLPIPPPEPLPSATDVRTIALSISQLADFSATMVYLLWHERYSPVASQHSSWTFGNGGASSAFKKYCRSILQATQLSESVVLLSLKYIVLLLQNNPQLRGADGSEYRLYTVALMLANKFLDDNTFTNKTWSDLSGMKMHELNMMEFEFLDVLQYVLFIQKADFDQWRTTLFNFRNRLHDPANTNDSIRGLQQQQFIESTLKSMGIPLQQQQQQQQQQQHQDTQWSQHQQFQQQKADMQYHHHHHHHHQHQQHQHQQQQQQQQQQQHAAAAVAAQQQYNQHLYLLSKAQQPHIPLQQLNRPLARVPLRIPIRPLYPTQNGQVSSSASATQTSTAYDSSIDGISATVIQPSSASIPQLVQQIHSTHTPHEHFQVDAYSRHNNQPPSAPNVPPHASFYAMEIYPQQQQQQQQQLQIPQPSIQQQHINPLSNGLTAIATATSPLQHISTQPTSTPTTTFYYSTPSATPSSSQPYHHDHSQPTPSHHSHQHYSSMDYINGNNNSNVSHKFNYGSRSAYHMKPPHQHDMPTPTSYGEYKNYATSMVSISNDMYGDPTVGRISSNPSYQNHSPLNGPAGQPPTSTNHRQQQSISSPSKKQPVMTRPTSGPVPEDPLTAAESYRVPSYD